MIFSVFVISAGTAEEYLLIPYMVYMKDGWRKLILGRGGVGGVGI